MEEKRFVAFKKDELSVRENIKKSLGKGKISDVSIEYTPVGEKIRVFTSRPGLVIGRKGEKIESLTRMLKRKFKLDNPHIEIVEITEPMLDAQLVADEIALLLERRGSLKFKVIAYKTLQQIIKAGARGVELRLSGKLPGDRARTWRFAHGYLKKTGEPSKMVDRALAQATTMSGVVGIQVAILHPNSGLKDSIDVDSEMKEKIAKNALEMDSPKEEPKATKKKETKKKVVKKKSTKKVLEVAS